MGALSGKVAVVTGASRGVGKGCALALAEEGATVYLTGRSVNEGDYYLPGTVHATAKEVDERGGKGIAVVVDHHDDTAVEALFERVKAEQGRLDILVNNCFYVPDELLQPGSFWEKSPDMWGMVDIGARSHYVASIYGARIMVPQGHGLIVNTSSPGGGKYSLAVAYGVGKAALDRMTVDMAHELRPHNIAVISLWLGLIATERTMRAFEVYPGMFNPDNMESQEFTGRMIVALAQADDVMTRSGGVYYTAELAQEYGVTDAGGKQPASGRPNFGAPPWPLPEAQQ
jgi:NAD(P)-dependent dehydrogenase (short-subunit alcohol dehydrogenase family)